MNLDSPCPKRSMYIWEEEDFFSPSALSYAQDFYVILKEKVATYTKLAANEERAIEIWKKGSLGCGPIW